MPPDTSKVLKDLERDIRTLGLADERLSCTDFVAMLRQGMDGAFLAGERGAGVNILNFHDARGLTFGHLFMGGLNEGVCPSGTTVIPFSRTTTSSSSEGDRNPALPHG